MTVDPTRPNGGRMYDYWLGGSHNFEADRQAAEHILSIAPSAQSIAKINRWFLLDVIPQLVAEGHAQFLDLATGLPTEGYIHDLAPDAKLVYNDIDPVTVAYARDLIGDNPNICYVQSDLGEIEPVLAAASEHLDPDQTTGICFVGASYFIDNPTIKRVLKRLYEWARPGSAMAMSWLIGDRGDDDPIMQLYASLGSPVTMRTPELIGELLGNWQLGERGLLPLQTWLELDDENAPSADEPWMYGCIVHKPAA